MLEFSVAAGCLSIVAFVAFVVGACIVLSTADRLNQ